MAVVPGKKRGGIRWSKRSLWRNDTMKVGSWRGDLGFRAMQGNGSNNLSAGAKLQSSGKKKIAGKWVKDLKAEEAWEEQKFISSDSDAAAGTIFEPRYFALERELYNGVSSELGSGGGWKRGD